MKTLTLTDKQCEVLFDILEDVVDAVSYTHLTLPTSDLV